MTLGTPDSVELLFDQTSRTVGVRGVDAAAEHAYAVRSVAGPGAAPFVISAMAFLRFYGIATPVSRRWAAYFVDGILCVDLDGESVAVTSNRAKRARTTEYR